MNSSRTAMCCLFQEKSEVSHQWARYAAKIHAAGAAMAGCAQPLKRERGWRMAEPARKVPGKSSPVFARGRGDELDSGLIKTRPAVRVFFAPADEACQEAWAVVVDCPPDLVGKVDVHGDIACGNLAIQFQQESVRALVDDPGQTGNALGRRYDGAALEACSSVVLSVF